MYTVKSSVWHLWDTTVKHIPPWLLLSADRWSHRTASRTAASLVVSLPTASSGLAALTALV